MGLIQILLWFFKHIAAIVKVMFEKDETKKKELHESMKNETTPAFLKHMTTILTKNGGQYMVGKGVSKNLCQKIILSEVKTPLQFSYIFFKMYCVNKFLANMG